jgi:murein DD-endopeptidase MepM/ murein hydrolase activator NlpD
MPVSTADKKRIRSSRPTNVEVQIHPSDIRKGVRYLFLSRLQLALLTLLLLGYFTFTVASAVVAPEVAATLIAQREYRSMLQTRELLGERLEALHGRFDELNQRAEALHMSVSKIYLAYGLTNDASIGQGGYPFEARPIPASIFSEAVARTAAEEARLAEQASVLQAFLQEIDSFESAHLVQLRWTPSISPLQGDEFVLTSPFGTRRSPFTKQLDFHAGIDLSAPAGTKIYAPAAGRVNFAGRYPLRQSVAWWRYGNLVSIAHGEEFVTLYGHCDQIEVRRGQRVEQGDLLGTVGNTGWSTNPHLHYEVRRLGADDELRPVDPRIYMLDHRWRDEEELLVRARSAPPAEGYEPLPGSIRR